jgi:CRISPR-associated endonuclease/helicase Cas3
MDKPVLPSLLVRKLWAKTDPFHPLYCHMIDVGCVAKALLATKTFRSVIKRFSVATGCTEDQVINWLAYLIALHDIGKCRADFEAKGPEELIKPLEEMGLDCVRVDQKYRHEAMSAMWVYDLLMNTFHWERPEAGTVSAVIRGHHGNFRVDNPDDETGSYKNQWEPLRVELEAVIREVFTPGPWIPKFSDHSTVGILLSGLLVISDWIASNNELFCMDSKDATLVEYVELSQKRAKGAVAKLSLDIELLWANNRAFFDIWPNISHPRPIQSHCELLCQQQVIKPGLAIIEAPMGEGKTEAAIYLASQWLADSGLGGIYIALPTAATSNQMYGRFKEFLERHDSTAAKGVRLVHGMAWLLDEDTPEREPELSVTSLQERGEALDWFRPKKRSLLASYGVGTIDQALMSVLHVKHGFLRLFGLTGKILVIDEVHAYDAYMSEILMLLLKWCGHLGIPVILLSATLPEQRRQLLLKAYSQTGAVQITKREDLAPYPLLTFGRADGEVREEKVNGSSKCITVRLVKHFGLLGDAGGVARLVFDRAKQGGCFCVIANTVNSAQQIYQELNSLANEAGDEIQLLLFHARFRVARRQSIEELALALFDKRSLLPEGDPNWQQRPPKVILVATQVVEQSLDLDFDEMFTEVAPIDLILQRAGRLHRHDRQERPTGREARLHLLLPGPGLPEFDINEKVYQRYILLKTLAALEKYEELKLPEVIRSLVEMVYDEDVSTDCLPKVTEEQDFKDSLKKLKEELSEEAGKAAQYLIPQPYLPAFKLARVGVGAFDESEGDASSYFAAKTRIGEETWQLLVLEGTAFSTELSGKRAPGRETMKEIFRQTVNVPKWWCNNIEAVAGYKPLEKAPGWLPGASILRLTDGCWKGRDQKGKIKVIKDDQRLGLIYLDEEGV